MSDGASQVTVGEGIPVRIRSFRPPRRVVSPGPAAFGQLRGRQSRRPAYAMMGDVTPAPDAAQQEAAYQLDLRKRMRLAEEAILGARAGA